MPRRVLVQQLTGSFELIEKSAPDEKHLQDVVKLHPSLIPAEDLGLDGDLLVVGRETRLASGAIDLMCLSRSGGLVLVEFKTGPENPDFRHALAQVIDYGSDLWRTTVADFDQGIVQRYLHGPYAEPGLNGVTSLKELVDGSSWELDDNGWESLQSRLSEVLDRGDFDFVVAAQRFTPSMISSLDYLNSTVRHGRFFLLQVVMLHGADMHAYSAQVVAGPGRSAGLAKSTAGQVDEAAFLASLEDPAYREAVQDLFSTFKSLGLSFGWGSRGTSIRLQTEDRAEPLSIGWAFPPGVGWQGVRHFGLGVDSNSASQTPSISSELSSYLAAVEGIPGGVPLKAKALSGRSFVPTAVVEQKSQIAAVVEGLVADINGED